MPGSLWTPTGERPIAERGVEPVTRDEIITLSKMHEVAFNHDIVMLCKRCDRPFTGNNNASSKVLAIQCLCRELRFDGR